MLEEQSYPQKLNFQHYLSLVFDSSQNLFPAIQSAKENCFLKSLKEIKVVISNAPAYSFCQTEGLEKHI